MISINGKIYVDNSHNYDYNIFKVKLRMSNRLFYASVCTASLMFGGVLYLLFRENTYIAMLFEGNGLLERIRGEAKCLENDFLSFYLPDYLWGLSLCFGLCLVFDPKKLLGIITCCAVAFAYGTIWETLQKFRVVGGTGDTADVILYLAASLTAVLICIKRRNRNEKSY